MSKYYKLAREIDKAIEENEGDIARIWSIESILDKLSIPLEAGVEPANGGHKTYLKPLLKKILEKKHYLSETGIPDYLRNVVTTNDIRDVFLDYNIELED